MQFIITSLATLGLLTAVLASPTIYGAILQKRDDANTTAWFPTTSPQQFCQNITVDMQISPEPNSSFPDCTALRAKYAGPVNATADLAGILVDEEANNGYWNVSVDMHATIINTTWPFSILAQDENCTFYVETAYLIDPSVNFQLGNIDFVNIIDTVISGKASNSGHVTCKNPASNVTSLGGYWVGAGRPVGYEHGGPMARSL